MGNYCCCEREQSTLKSSKSIIPTSSIKRSEVITDVRKQTNTSPTLAPQNIDEKTIARHGPENYQSLKYLGRGTFGDVVLAEDKETSKQYAMKIIDKSKIKEVNLMQCKTIKQISHQDILVSIRQTFQNENKIYIIMEYLNKGDIYFYLKKKQVIFTQDVIRNLIAQIIYGVEVLHNYGIIYRELKPQNILVTNDGHIKLTDYGLSKMLIEDRTYTCTFVGALQYMAPQAIKGKYSKQVDLWSIGILIFQLTFQKNPFASHEHTELAIQNNIQRINIEQVLNEKIGLISQQLRDLLLGLLQKNPSQRLTIQQLKVHPFFKQVNWDDIKERRNHPPLKQFIEKNDHIRFRDPTNDAEISHRVIKYTNRQGKQDYKTNLFQFRSSN